MKNPNSKAHDLFLLMFNLSQITLHEKLIKFFIEALEEIWPEISVSYHLSVEKPGDTLIEISSSDSQYGFIQVDNFIELENEEQNLLQNAVSMLSIILKKNEQEKRLSDEKWQLQKLVDEKINSIKESEHDLKKAQSIARMGNWKWNLKTQEVIWSDEMFRIFGIDKNSYKSRLGDVIAKVIHPDDLHLVLPTNAPKISEKKPIEYRIILPDKSIRYILAEAGETIFDENSNPLFLTGIAQDITDRKLLEIELIKAKEHAEESETRFRNYIQSSPTAVFLVNKQGNYTFVNSSACKLLGYSEQEMLQLSYFDIVKPDNNEKNIGFIDIMQLGQIQNVEKILLRKDGQAIDVIFDGKKLSENEYIGFVKDITGRKLAEKELKESEERFKALHNASFGGIAIHDKGLILECNQGLSEITGYSYDELIGMDGLLLIAPAARDMVRIIFWQVTKSLMKQLVCVKMGNYIQ